MRRKLTTVVAASMIALATVATVGGQSGDNDKEVMAALDAFLNGWNSRDAKQFASALHFPHVVFEGGTPRVTQSGSEFIARGAELWATAQPGWDRSVWEDRRIIQRLPGVVHVAGQWARLDKSGKVIGRANVLYIVASKDGRWAIAARSGSRGAQGALKVGK